MTREYQMYINGEWVGAARRPRCPRGVHRAALDNHAANAQTVSLLKIPFEK